MPAILMSAAVPASCDTPPTNVPDATNVTVPAGLSNGTPEMLPIMDEGSVRVVKGLDSVEGPAWINLQKLKAPPDNAWLRVRVIGISRLPVTESNDPVA